LKATQVAVVSPLPTQLPRSTRPAKTNRTTPRDRDKELNAILPRQSRLPLWLKVLYTAFAGVLVPYYWRTYGALNFLYFCDVALLIALP
jgi:hypothetical protein